MILLPECKYAGDLFVLGDRLICCWHKQRPCSGNWGRGRTQSSPRQSQRWGSGQVSAARTRPR